MSRSYGQQQVQDIIGYQYQDRTFLIEALHAGQRIFYFPKNVKEVASQRFGECAQGSKFDNDSTTPMAPNGDIGRSSDAPFPTIQHNPPNSSNRQMRYTVSKHPPYWVAFTCRPSEPIRKHVRHYYSKPCCPFQRDDPEVLPLWFVSAKSAIFRSLGFWTGLVKK